MQDKRQTDASIVIDRGIGGPIVAVSRSGTLPCLFREWNIVDRHIFLVQRIFDCRTSTRSDAFPHMDLDIFGQKICPGSHDRQQNLANVIGLAHNFRA